MSKVYVVSSTIIKDGKTVPREVDQDLRDLASSLGANSIQLGIPRYITGYSEEDLPFLYTEPDPPSNPDDETIKDIKKTLNIDPQNITLEELATKVQGILRILDIESGRGGIQRRLL